MVNHPLDRNDVRGEAGTTALVPADLPGWRLSRGQAPHLATGLDVGRRLPGRLKVDRGPAAGVVQGARAEIPADGHHPLAILGPRVAGIERACKRLAIPGPPPLDRVEIEWLRGPDGLAGGKETVGKDVFDVVLGVHGG